VGSSTGGKSAASLEKEIMRLQDVLKEREAEIALLEESLKAAESKAKNSPTPAPITTRVSGLVGAPPLLRIDSAESEEFATPIGDHPDFENPSGRSTPVSSSPIPPMNLSPKTMNQFRAIRKSLDFGEFTKFNGDDLAPPLGQDDSLQRLNELMR